MPAPKNAQLPGFGLSLGFTISYLSLLVLIPLGACFVMASSLSPSEFIRAVWTERARSAYALTFGVSAISASVNVFLGLLVAWVLARYEFPCKRVFDALVDLPFALPTAVAGLVYSNLYAANGWLGRFLAPLGIHAAYSRLAIVVVLVFTGFPFVVRTVQPVLEDLDADVEEAAATLGATRRQTFFRVLLPTLFPAVLTGFSLSFARALGEYGSVVFVSGNMPNETEIAPVLIVAKLEQFAFAEATAIAVVLLVFSLLMLLAINAVESYSERITATILIAVIRIWQWRQANAT
ncbi:MAG: sulfate ABC transporter permease subunit CysT [Candidatus Acidiferrum sp.]